MLLGLWDIRHSIIGDERVRGISGGQRKRVNIGMEMVADPTVLFLGEWCFCVPSCQGGPLNGSVQMNPRRGLTVPAQWRCAKRCVASQKLASQLPLSFTNHGANPVVSLCA